MVIRDFRISYFDMSATVLVCLLLFISIKFGGIWYDNVVFYKNILRSYDNQIIFKDYLCHFFPIINYVYFPVIKIFNFEVSIFFFTFLVSFVFSYVISKDLYENFNIEFIKSFFLTLFFFIPFGIGTLNHDNLVLALSTISILIFFTNEKNYIYSSIIITLALFIKFSVTLFILIPGLFSYMLYKILNKDWNNFKYVLYAFVISFLLSITLLYFYIYNSELNLVEIKNYFFSTSDLAKERTNVSNFFFLNQITSIIQLNSIGVFFQLPIILAFYFFLLFFIIQIFKKNFYKKNFLILFYLLAHWFLFNFSGRDWNHKSIFGFVLLFIFFQMYFDDINFVKKKLCKNFLIILSILVYSLIPINERYDLKKIPSDKLLESKLSEYFINFPQSSLYFSSERSKFYKKNNVINIGSQMNEIDKFIKKNSLIDSNFFFLDELSSIFSLQYKSAPCDLSCMNGDYYTPTKYSKNLENYWTSKFLKVFKDKKGILILCKINENQYCSQQIFIDQEGKFYVGPRNTFNTDLDFFIREREVLYNTENFYILR